MRMHKDKSLSTRTRIFEDINVSVNGVYNVHPILLNAFTFEREKN